MLLLPPSDEDFSVETRDASPANLLMKIQSFSLLSKYGIRKYESREFDAGGYKWKLIFYPDGLESELEGESEEKGFIKEEGKKEEHVSVCNIDCEIRGLNRTLIIYPDGLERELEGKSEEIGFIKEEGKKEEEKKEEHVSVYLSTVATSSLPAGWEVNAIFTFFLHNQISDNYLSFRGMVRRFNAVNPTWGFRKLISKKTLIDPSNGYVLDDNCVLGAEVYVIVTKRISECVSLLKPLSAPCKREFKFSNFSNLGSVWNSDDFLLGGHKWMVKLYPKGNASETSGHISVYVHSIDSKTFAPHQKLKAEVLLHIKSKLHDSHHTKLLNHWYTSCSQSDGCAEFVAISDMSNSSKGYLVDDCLLLDVEISVQALVLA